MIDADKIYDFYVNELGEDSFDDLKKLIHKATDIIESYILNGNREDNIYLKKAICAEVLYLKESGSSVMYGESNSSYKIGNYSVSGSENGNNSNSMLCSESKNYLIKSGLLYRGVM